ncbi:MAG: hypothetical protein K6G03_03780 [Lachnospiraceae bacterium]|nr:hypothetical protein [Lachnospiraceae bacterium]
MNKTKERLQFLRKELEEYEAVTTMTSEERTALREWVEGGNSVHDNGSMAVYEGGRPMDFLDVYREEEEIRKTLNSLEGKEKDKFLRELKGEENEDDLREKCDHYWFVMGVYEHVLRRHGLMQEAEEEIKAAEKRSEDFIRALGSSDDELEKPFEDGRCYA